MYGMPATPQGSCHARAHSSKADHADIARVGLHRMSHFVFPSEKSSYKFDAETCRGFTLRNGLASRGSGADSTLTEIGGARIECATLQGDRINDNNGFCASLSTGFEEWQADYVTLPRDGISFIGRLGTGFRAVPWMSKYITSPAVWICSTSLFVFRLASTELTIYYLKLNNIYICKKNLL